MRVILIILAVVCLVSGTFSSAFAKNSLSDREILAKYAACLVQKVESASRDFVLSGSFFDATKNSKLLKSGCLKLRGSMIMSDDILKGAIAESLLQKEPELLARSDFAAVPLLTFDQPWPIKTMDVDGKPLSQKQINSQTEAVARKHGVLSRQRLGECVVRSDSAGSRNLLYQIVGTSEEMESVKALQPALAGCIIAGETVSLDRISIRSNITAAYYRLASATSLAGENS
ncbi:MAG: hypothetical protein WAT93_02700 [Pontixanthobacter sp.]